MAYAATLLITSPDRWKGNALPEKISSHAKTLYGRLWGGFLPHFLGNTAVLILHQLNYEKERDLETKNLKTEDEMW